MSTIQREGITFSAHFTMVPNQWLRDGRLTLKAAALLFLLLSHEPGWRTSVRQLVADRQEGRDAIMAGIAELEKYGYLRREQTRDEKGKMSVSIWTLLDPFGSSPQAPWSENPITVDESENPRSEPESDYPSSGEPRSGDQRTKKTKVKKTNPEEHQGNGPAAATEAQREFLKDLHRHGGGGESESIAAWIDSLTGRDYVGDPDNPNFTWKGREVAAARMIPGGRQPRPAPEVVEALF
jgi:hypothetical protein